MWLLSWLGRNEPRACAHQSCSQLRVMWSVYYYIVLVLLVNYAASQGIVSVLKWHDDTLYSISVSQQDVFDCLSSLYPTKAMGPDGIPGRVLKLCKYSLTEPIHHLFSECLRQSYLPEEWRLHYVVPIPKSGDKSSASNYRFGFLKRRSTVKQLLCFIDTIYSGLNSSQQVDVLYLDIRKAFDSVPHDGSWY